jgi:hypothetical protein
LFVDPGNDILKGLQTWIGAIGEANYSRIQKLYIYSHYHDEHLQIDDLREHIADIHTRRNFPFVVVDFEDVYTDDSTDPERRYRLGIPPPAQESSEGEFRAGGSLHGLANESDVEK